MDSQWYHRRTRILDVLSVAHEGEREECYDMQRQNVFRKSGKSNSAARDDEKNKSTVSKFNEKNISSIKCHLGRVSGEKKKKILVHLKQPGRLSCVKPLYAASSSFNIPKKHLFFRFIYFHADKGWLRDVPCHNSTNIPRFLTRHRSPCAPCALQLTLATGRRRRWW